MDISKHGDTNYDCRIITGPVFEILYLYIENVNTMCSCLQDNVLVCYHIYLLYLFYFTVFVRFQNDMIIVASDLVVTRLHEIWG